MNFSQPVATEFVEQCVSEFGNADVAGIGVFLSPNQALIVGANLRVYQFFHAHRLLYHGQEEGD